jgi:CRISPR system Cascade subunit CasC
LDTDKLAHNLQGANDIEALIKQVVPALLRAMAFSNPSGKQNSFASHSLPVAVLVECKEQKIPVSYMNAFIKPAVASRQNDLIEDSIDKLVNEVKCTTADFSLPVEKRLWFCSSKYADEKFPDDVAMNCKDFNTLIDSLASLL